MLATLAALALMAAPAAPEPPPPVVTWADERVTADVRGVSRAEVLAALARETGVELHGTLADDDPISLRLERARFRDAVDRVLGEQNFTITYDATGRPRRVDLWGMPRRVAPVKPRTRRPGEFATLIGRQAPVELPPSLAAALGIARSRLPWVLRRGLRHEDPDVGTAAASLFAHRIDSDPGLHAAFLRADDQELANLLRAWGGTGAERLAGILAGQSRDPLVRAKAARVRNLLRPATARPASAPRG